MRIFVQIASYRDPELVPTIRHCIQRAKHPKNLSFGICWQHEEDEKSLDNTLKEIAPNCDFRIVSIPYKESKGACWARSKTNELYDGEEFTLQLDSHMRFIQSWDEEVLKIWNDLKDPKAILTAYPAEYTPDETEESWISRSRPLICNVFAFSNGQTQQRPDFPHHLSEWNKPYKALHVAAGFIFGPGSLIEDVPYDPEFYFCGEETALTIRFFTHGYNLYHPHKSIMFHYYIRKGFTRHWDDLSNWTDINTVASDRLERLLERTKDIDLGKYGLGSVRSLRDFEIYSGIDYARKVIHLDTLEKKEPPVDYSDMTKWCYEKKQFKKTLKWEIEKLDKCSDYRFWAFIIRDQHGQDIFREDFKVSGHPEGGSVGADDVFSGKVTEREFVFEYYSPRQEPTAFVIWPYSETKGWINSTTWSM